MNPTRFLPALALASLLLLVSGCLYDHAPSGPSCSIDTWAVGTWEAKDKAGRTYSATVTRQDSDHYSVLFGRKGDRVAEFEGWISRVDGFPVLTLRSMDGGPTHGKFSLFHYELLSPAPAPPGGIGARRIRLSELQLDESARSLDSYRLRAEIRRAFRAGTLLSPRDSAEGTPGSVVWTRTGDVTLRGETF